MRSRPLPEVEAGRELRGAYGSPPGSGIGGRYCVWRTHRVALVIVASNGGGWDHVSVSAHEDGRPRIPTWAEMCFVKSQFWHEEEAVMELHPARSQYVNYHPCVLHLWKPQGEVKIPLPPLEFVGPRSAFSERFSLSPDIPPWPLNPSP